MTFLWMSLLACSSKPEAKVMGPRDACYTLKDEVPDQCLTMALEAHKARDAEAALFGLTIACRNGLDQACEAAPRLPEIGVEPYDASLAVGKACLNHERKPACQAFLTLLDGDPKSTPKLIERARAIVAGTSPETPTPDAAHGGE